MIFMNLIEFWFFLGIAILIMLILNYLIIIRSWLNFMNEVRHRNMMYQAKHNESNQENNDSES